MPIGTSRAAALAVAVALAVSAPVLAQDGHEGHDAPVIEGDGPSSGLPAVGAYLAAMDRMHSEMSVISYTGDADIDFALAMIPHHRAAIEMAEALLAHGEHPEIRALAEEIIVAQEAEIAQLEAWLAVNDLPPEDD